MEDRHRDGTLASKAAAQSPLPKRSARSSHPLRALDTPDFEKSFLSLWSLLEKLTATRATENYEKTIARTLFIWKNPEINKAVLEHLRHHRNTSVHAGSSSNQQETLTIQLKRYVEQMILFHLRIRPRFRSLDEARQFLDLPADSKLLKNRIDLSRRALRFRT